MMFDVEKAKKAQIELSKRVIVSDIDLDKVDTVVGLDVSYRKSIGVGAAVAYSLKKDRELCYEVVRDRVEIPYIPGLLAFREFPLMFKALYRLMEKCVHPDVLMVNGHGVSHPRRFGIASHVGVVTNISSIGVARSYLFGEIVDRGSDKLIVVDGRVVGYVVKNNGFELYVSVGHRISPQQALALVLATWKKGRRLPEPLYLADTISRRSL